MKGFIAILVHIVILASVASPAHAEEPSVPDTALVSWFNKIQLSGTLDGDLRWMRQGDLSASDAASSSDLYIRMLEIGIQTSFLAWASATAVLNSEWLGDPVNLGNEQLAVDEVHLDIRVPQTPLYGVLGKRTQPFGVFESDLITDPITQDAYETRRVGLTASAAGPRDSDLSVTVYKGKEQMGHLFASGLIDTAVVKLPAQRVAQVESWIAALSVAPFPETLTLFGSVLSEPGRTRRNLTANAGLSFTVPWHRPITIDLEGMRAMRRERYAGMREEFREGVFSATGVYRIGSRARKPLGSGNYVGRKSHLRAHPVEAVVRWERFDDDGMTRKLGAWTLRDRIAAGGRYTFFEGGRILAYTEAEYRHVARRTPAASAAKLPDGNEEFYLRLGLDF